jgi:hypothetical protein
MKPHAAGRRSGGRATGLADLGRILQAPARSKLAAGAAVVTLALGGVLLARGGSGLFASAAPEGGTATKGDGPAVSASPAKPNTSAAGARPSSSHSRATPRPAAGSARAPVGFPGASNTGYQNAPGYPGKLTTYSSRANGSACSGPIRSGRTYRFCKFVGKGGAAALTIGTTRKAVENVTFFGCLFVGNAVDNAVITYANGNNITFDYVTIAPSAVPAPPVPYGKGYQYGINQVQDDRPDNYLHGRGFTLDHADVWGFGNGIQLGSVTKANPVVIRNSWFHDASEDGGDIYHTDAILSSDGDGIEYLTVDHNTIVSRGNTNGLALQYAGSYYSNITVTNNYFSGFGYTVNIGGDGRGNRNVRFTGNVFGTDIRPRFGPLYGWTDGNGNLWRGNRWNVAPGGYSSRKADDGKYWWPDGTLSTSDYNR